MTDAVLLERAAHGDETAFLLLYERHRDAVVRFAYRLLGSMPAAEDVTHDCFVSLIGHPTRFDPARAAFRTYLFAAARNLAISQLRQGARETDLEIAADQPATCSDRDPLHQLLNQELADRVREVVSALPPLQREAVILFEYEDLSLAEIAGVVGTDIGTVKSRLHRARERLRRSLTAEAIGSVAVMPRRHVRDAR